jgi:hypothetical protein
VLLGLHHSYGVGDEDGRREKWTLRIPWHCRLSQSGALSELSCAHGPAVTGHEPQNSHSRTLPWCSMRPMACTDSDLGSTFVSSARAATEACTQRVALGGLKQLHHCALVIYVRCHRPSTPAHDARPNCPLFPTLWLILAVRSDHSHVEIVTPGIERTASPACLGRPTCLYHFLDPSQPAAQRRQGFSFVR